MWKEEKSIDWVNLTQFLIQHHIIRSHDHSNKKHSIWTYSNEDFNLRHALYIFFISCSNEFLHLNSSKCDNNYGDGGGCWMMFFIHHNVYSTVVCNENRSFRHSRRWKQWRKFFGFYNFGVEKLFKNSHPSRSVSCFSFPGN